MSEERQNFSRRFLRGRICRVNRQAGRAIESKDLIVGVQGLEYLHVRKLSCPAVNAIEAGDAVNIRLGVARQVYRDERTIGPSSCLEILNCNGLS